MKGFKPDSVRGLFPALNGDINGVKPVFLDGPGGTQVPQSVMDAITGYMSAGNSNLWKSDFFAVQNTHNILRNARERAAAFVNGRPEEIVFGATMSALTAGVSRSIAREWEAGDEIIVSALDHYANVSFWEQVAQERGVTVRRIPVHRENCDLDYGAFEELVSGKTKLVACTLAANICGTITDAPRIMRAAKSVGARTYLDAVHYAPHYLPNVKALDCDFLACSGYKFFGPHQAFLWGKEEHWKNFAPYKVEPAPAEPPDSWEAGTKSFEALAGLVAAIDYIAAIGGEAEDLRARLNAAYGRIVEYEKSWSLSFLERAADHKGLKIYGYSDANKAQNRTSTFAITIDGYHPQVVSDHLATHQIITGAGNFYAKGVTEALGLEDKGGVLRIGAVHYNTLEEINRLFEVLDMLS